MLSTGTQPMAEDWIIERDYTVGLVRLFQEGGGRQPGLHGFPLQDISYPSIIYLEKSTHSLSIHLSEFSHSEHDCVTRTQIKNQDMADAQKLLLGFLSATPQPRGILF